MNKLTGRKTMPRLTQIIRAAAGALLATAGSTWQPAHASPVPPHGIAATRMEVEQLGFENGSENVAVTQAFTIGDFLVRSSANRGDYDVQIGEVLSDDVDTGVVMTSISENGGRDNVDQFGGSNPIYPGINTATAHLDYSRSGANAGGYFIPVAMTYPNSAGTTVVEYNLNVAAAWFPYDQYLGAFVRNVDGANGGANDLLTGHASLLLGTHFVDLGGGRSTVDLTSLGIDSQKDGVLLATGAKNEDNFALVQPNPEGTWTIYSKDNGTDGTSTEQDPVAFVYIPRTNSLVVSGRFRGDGVIEIAGGDFSVTPLAEGQWELKVAGHSPHSGVLIISPQGGMEQNRDNIVSYEANDAGDGWIIESRDLPNTVPPGETMPPLETPGTELVASFVFIPGATPGVTAMPNENVFTTENGGTGSFEVTLDSEPLQDVTVTVLSDNPAEGTAFPDVLYFTPLDWNMPRTVVVTGQDDEVLDGAVEYRVLLAASSLDEAYNLPGAFEVQLLNLDNDGAFTVLPTAGLVVTETGGAASFIVRLEQAPTAPVEIALEVSDTREAMISPTLLTFTPDNWMVEQTVTVTGLDDMVDDGEVAFSIVTAAAVSQDPYFNGKDPADVSVASTDNDTAGIQVDPTSGFELVESLGAASYNVVLASEPTAEVRITPTADLSGEVTIAPAALVFDASNWSTPQAVSITAVDDLVADGNQAIVITHSVTTEDAIYAAILPAAVTAATLDNEAEIVLSQDAVIYGTGMPAVGIAGDAIVIDSNTLFYEGATLTVQLTANAQSADELAIRSSGAGGIAVSGNTVTYAGLEIGSFSGGQNGTALVVNLTANATPAEVQVLLHAITFRSLGDDPSRALRQVTLTLADADGGVSMASTSIRVGLLRRTDFQEGADHGHGIYTGAADIELNELAMDTPQPTGRGASGLWIDWRDPDNANAGQVLLRFDNIIGDGPGQVPTNAIIVSAELYLHMLNSGDGSPLHRMMVPWDAEFSTWYSVGFGITPDDFRARSQYDSQIGVENGTGSTTAGTVWVSVTPDVEAWVSGGEPNYGWVMPGWMLNLDGTGFSPSEAENIAERPRLRVHWLPADSVTVASFRQGVNGYEGVVDTRLRQNAPDEEASTVASVFVDSMVSSGGPNPEQVLLRFNDITGAGPNQVPPGKRVEAAVVDLASVISNGMGDGGTFHALLQDWDPLSTWNSWGDGIQTNDVEAAASASATAGSPELTPDVQGGFLSFDLTADVQAWVSGTRPNAGWVVMPWEGGGNGWGFATSEDFMERNRPRLRVYYTDAEAVVEIPVTIQSPIMAEGSVTLHFTGSADISYEVYRAAEATGSWEKVGSVSTDSGGTGTYTDNSPLDGTGFYQISRP